MVGGWRPPFGCLLRTDDELPGYQAAAVGSLLPDPESVPKTVETICDLVALFAAHGIGLTKTPEGEYTGLVRFTFPDGRWVDLRADYVPGRYEDDFKLHLRF